jgi:hypothetical protein
VEDIYNPLAPEALNVWIGVSLNGFRDGWNYGASIRFVKNAAHGHCKRPK